MAHSASDVDRSPARPDTQSKLPIRVGVFDSLAAAEHAVDALYQNGFTSQEITVFCSNEQQEQHFGEELEPPRTAKSNTANLQNAAAGSAIGSVLGGLTAVAGLVTLGGLPILIAGGMAGALTGGVVGGLTGAMASRGVETEPADFFDQAVAEGNILVSVEPTEPERLTLAAQIIDEAGSKPLPLREG